MGMGLRQKQMLELMWRNGGVYPPEYRIGFYQREILDSLVRNGWAYLARHSSGRMVYRMTAMRDPRHSSGGGG